jgi:predicted ester cyclase
MSADKTAIARRWFDEVWNQRREETIEELIPHDSVCHMDGQAMTGPHDFRTKQYLPFTSAFPDARVEVEDTVEQGDQVVVRWKATATHGGEGIGCKATGRKVTFYGMSWIRVVDGKFREGWQSSNISEVIRELHACAANA